MKDENVKTRRLIMNIVLLTLVFWPCVESGWGEEGTSESEPLEGMRAFGRERVKDPTQLTIQMMKEVRRRHEELSAREAEIRRKEEKLKALELELQEAIERLKEQQQELLAVKKALREEEEARVQQLARVFDSAPPEQGGKLLSELDPDIAARVLERMNSRKAGRLWGYVDPQKAAQISEILTRRSQ
jgi:flagellar motility protein MotE (MotC chaperone)